MTASSFNLILTIYLSLICPRSLGLEVVQPHNRTVSPDGVASISCQFAAENMRLVDVRLNAVSPADTKRTMLCQKGSDSCHVRKIYIMQEDPGDTAKWLFFMNNIQPKDMNVPYECEFTMIDTQGHYSTWRGKPTALLAGQTEADCAPLTAPSAPSPPPASRPDHMGWILIGMLAQLLLCMGVIACLYIRLRKSKEELDNGTYVEMRKAPLLRSTAAGVYCVN